MLQTVTVLFDTYIKSKLDQKPEVMKAVLNHERKQVCLQNLCAQIKAVEAINPAWNKGLMIKTVDSVADLFMKSVLEHWKQSAMSELVRKQKTAEADKMANANEVLEEYNREALEAEGLPSDGQVKTLEKSGEVTTEAQ